MADEQLSRIFAALADPTRRDIVARLAVGDATVSELAEPYDVSVQAVSKHLAYLEKARLVAKRRQGRVHVCRLNPTPLREVAEWAATYRAFWDQSFDRLDSYLDQLKAKEKTRERKD